MFTSTLALTVVLAVGAMAQSASSRVSAMITPTPTSSDDFAAQTTITGLVGTIGEGYAASILGAESCQTTMALACAADSYACDAVDGIELTVTQGPSLYEVYYSTAIDETSLAFSQSCDLEGPSGAFSVARCEFTVMAGVEGTSTASSGKTTIAGTQTDFQYAAIAVTAGAEKLPAGLAACTATASPGAAAPIGITREIYKVIVPVGAAIAAGAMM